MMMQPVISYYKYLYSRAKAADWRNYEREKRI